MPQGQLFINNKDAYTTWGISMDTNSLSALMTPSGMKDYISHSSRKEHGIRVANTTQVVSERQVTLTIQLTASNEQSFFSRYLSFCQELETGRLNIRTSFQGGVVYKFLYLSCVQFSQFNRGIAKFSLKLLEPNPKDRTA